MSRRLPEAAPREPRDADSSDDAADADLSRATVEELEAAGDAEGLLALARAHSKGANGAPKDLEKCLACYVAAARLGSAEGDYGAGLFYLTGRAIAQDFKEGAIRMRAAGEKGYLPAKIYVANLYELGVYYKSDTEKASVWYRNVARQAEVSGAIDSPLYIRAMSELGCVRYALLVQHDPEVSAADKGGALRKARAYGYQLPGAAPPATPSAAAMHVRAPARSEPTAAPAVTAPAAAPVPAVAGPIAPRLASSLAWGPGVGAFALASVFVAVAIAAGHVAVLGAREYVARVGELRLLGVRTELIVPATFVALGIVPLFFVYRAVTVVRASAVAAICAVIGYLGWIKPLARIAAERPTHAIIAASAGLLVTLLVLGIQGGARTKRHPRSSRVPRL